MEHKGSNLNLRWKISDILGFEVFNQNGTRLGVFSDVMSTKSNDIWVVKDYDEEILIPALNDIIKKVSIVGEKIFVVLPKVYEDIYGHVKSADNILEYNCYFVYED
ncbi:MAG: PRC-barrel domain-containing protein [Endomicrobium sp.]|jgi:16S rRNA processing protein RimM|nr:PRC-barrel domain-containing protein [Endomicrobium sp.]